mmetsp:Transcript_11729/g.25167  ORF Transcript_11729/g.25167 Transcript_11729/m.25167 type:complete len:91 (-) Transcript_11729:669-941(-)
MKAANTLIMPAVTLYISGSACIGYACTGKAFIATQIQGCQTQNTPPSSIEHARYADNPTSACCVTAWQAAALQVPQPSAPLTPPACPAAS